jgi:Domain of unknown function (DUF1815)
MHKRKELPVFYRLSEQYRQFIGELIVHLQALAAVMERRGYLVTCYTCGEVRESASFMVSLAPSHLVRFLVSEHGITWTEVRDDHELMRLEGAEAIAQLQELTELAKQGLVGQEMAVSVR